MKKIIIAVAGLIAVGVFAQSLPNGYFKQNSDGTIDVVATEAEVATVTTTGDITVGDDITIASDIMLGIGTATVTNGAVLAPTASIMYVLGVGGANDTTNTITLADPADGQMLTIIVDGSSTNLISIADSGLYLSGAWVGDNTDTITLVGYDDYWHQVSESDN